MGDKSRYWTFDGYLDSMPCNYEEIILETHIQVCRSPFHNKDINEDGTVKKPHYHFLVKFDGPTTFNNVSKLFAGIAANGYIQVVGSARGLYRYFRHADNPEKYQYKEEEYKFYNGFNPADLLSETDKNRIKWDIGKLIIDQDILEYNDLCEYLMEEGLYQEYFVTINATIHFKALCDSRRNKKMLQKKLD